MFAPIPQIWQNYPSRPTAKRGMITRLIREITFRLCQCIVCDLITSHQRYTRTNRGTHGRHTIAIPRSALRRAVKRVWPASILSLLCFLASEVTGRQSLSSCDLLLNRNWSFRGAVGRRLAVGRFGGKSVSLECITVQSGRPRADFRHFQPLKTYFFTSY